MIHNDGDHAANGRTLLAWVRAGIAVIAIGFVRGLRSMAIAVGYYFYIYSAA
jgi:uncharacterized membrane protein YidH (DUF202 family)